MVKKVLNRSCHTLFIDGKFVSDFYKKANIFNNLFASMCTPIKNASILPAFSYRTEQRINSFRVSEGDILAIMKTLDPAKAHGLDDISIKMIKICNDSITKPLKLIFEQSLKQGEFPNLWKKANVVPSHKKEDKTLVKNYRPISFSVKFLKELYITLFSIIF